MRGWDTWWRRVSSRNDQLDRCDNECKVVPGYQCIGGDPLHPDTCFEQCGTGKNLTGTKECDDGNLLPGDGCSPTCHQEDGYTCTSFPSICSETCGDGRNLGLLPCDDGNKFSGDGCSPSCEIELGFTCGGGNPVQRDICHELCGDGRNMGQLPCDDGNVYDGDGCSGDCVVEHGYQCHGGSAHAADECTEVCGDGFHIGLLECDDGNILDGDGCSKNCKLEEGWTCNGGSTSHRSICIEICGDGLNFGTVHFCDDGNIDNDDGCSSQCTTELGFTCFNTSTRKNSICYLLSQPKLVSISVYDDNQYLTVRFNESVRILEGLNTFQVYFEGRQLEYQAMQQISPVQQHVTLKLNSSWFLRDTQSSDESLLTLSYQSSTQLLTLRGNKVQSFSSLIYLNKQDKVRIDNCTQTMYLELVSIVTLLSSIALGILCRKELEVIQISQTIQLVLVITNSVKLESCFKYYIRDLGIVEGTSFYSQIIMIGPLIEDPSMKKYGSIISMGLIYYLIRLLTHVYSQVKMEHVLIGLSFAIKFITVPLIQFTISVIFQQQNEVNLSLASLTLVLLLFYSFRVKSLKQFLFIIFVSLTTQVSGQHHLKLKVMCILTMLLNEKVNIHRLDYAFLVVFTLLIILGIQSIVFFASYILIRCLQVVLLKYLTINADQFGSNCLNAVAKRTMFLKQTLLNLAMQKQTK
ncbi:hypothetical protein FGO68_gene15141 [Halteria grandinella]|uniref:Uncharacterized protein n=1 Tax=Halteria grandinella TaxID=5974 RepID=A0A8J8P0F6_HALGN|nr:hypothetical protein FGO68_gene15141 [Halteria grandinella]